MVHFICNHCHFQGDSPSPVSCPRCHCLVSSNQRNPNPQNCYPGQIMLFQRPQQREHPFQNEVDRRLLHQFGVNLSIPHQIARTIIRPTIISVQAQALPSDMQNVVRPLTPSKFNHRRIKRKEVKENAVCPICYEELRHFEKVCELPCKHLFHDKCIREWFKRESNCPMCRKVLGENPNMPDEQVPEVRMFTFIFS